MRSYKYLTAGILFLVIGFLFYKMKLFSLGIVTTFASFILLAIDRIKFYVTERKLDASNTLEQFINLEKRNRLGRFIALTHDALVILFALYIMFVIRIWTRENRLAFNLFEDPSGREILKIAAVGGVVLLIIEGMKKILSLIRDRRQ